MAKLVNRSCKDINKNNPPLGGKEIRKYYLYASFFKGACFTEFDSRILTF